MKLKIEFQKRDKLRTAAIVFPLNEHNVHLMIYTFLAMKRRFKSNDYVCIYDGKSPPADKAYLSTLFGVLIQVSSESRDSIADCVRDFIAHSDYRRVTFIGSECLALNNSQTQVTFTWPRELAKRTCNTFDMINPNVASLSSAQRVSANRAYQTCRHTYMYVHTGKSDSRGRELVRKKLSNEKFSRALTLSIDNLMSLKRRVCSFEHMERETVTDHEEMSKKVTRKLPGAPPLLQILVENSKRALEKGSYGYLLSKKRDYSLVDQRIAEQIKNNLSKQKEREKKRIAKKPNFNSDERTMNKAKKR